MITWVGSTAGHLAKGWEGANCLQHIRKCEGCECVPPLHPLHLKTTITTANTGLLKNFSALIGYLLSYFYILHFFSNTCQTQKRTRSVCPENSKKKARSLGSVVKEYTEDGYHDTRGNVILNTTDERTLYLDTTEDMKEIALQWVVHCFSSITVRQLV